MMRRLFTAACALSLLLCVATAVLWMRSYHDHGEPAFHRIAGTKWMIAVKQGHFILENERASILREWRFRSRDWFRQRIRDEELKRLWIEASSKEAKDRIHAERVAAYGALRAAERREQDLGQEFSPILSGSHGVGISRSIPCAAVAIAALAIPSAGAFWILGMRLNWSRRRHHGLCGSCGYDLCASEERCPECGTLIPAGGIA